MSSSDSEPEPNENNSSWAQQVSDASESGNKNPESNVGTKKPTTSEKKRKAPTRARSKSRRRHSTRSPTQRRRHSTQHESRHRRNSRDYSRRRNSRDYSHRRERSQSRKEYHDKKGYYDTKPKGSTSKQNQTSSPTNSNEKPSGKARKTTPAKPKDQSKFKMADYMDKIDNKLEKHIWVTDNKISEEMQATAYKLHIISMPTETMEEMTATVKDLIVNNDETRPTFITVSIFSRLYQELNTVGCENIANEIAHSAKTDGYMKRNIHITFATVDYKPGFQHLWDDIEETNHFFKQKSFSFNSLPFNLHRWVLRPAFNNRSEREVRGPLYEEYLNKQGLGLTLNDDGKQKVLEGLLRHHSSFTEPMGEINRVEAKPIPLDQTRGFKMDPPTEQNAWLTQPMGFMEGQMILEQQQRANRLLLVAQNNATINNEELAIVNNIDIQEQAVANPDLEEGEILEQEPHSSQAPPSPERKVIPRKEQEPHSSQAPPSTNKKVPAPKRKLITRKKRSNDSSDDSSDDSSETSSDSSDESSSKRKGKQPAKKSYKALEDERDLYKNLHSEKVSHNTYLVEKVADLEAKMAKYMQNLEDIENGIDKAKTENAKLKDQLSSYENQYQRDRNSIKNSNHEKDYLLKRIDVQTTAIRELESENLALKKELDINKELVCSLKKQNNLQEKKNRKEN